MNANKQLKLSLLLIILLECKHLTSTLINNDTVNSHERVVFLAPKLEQTDQQIQLNNEKFQTLFIFNNMLQHGWLIEADKKQTFHLHLLINDTHQHSSTPNYNQSQFINNNNKINQTKQTQVSIVRKTSLQNKQLKKTIRFKYTFYMYFTLNKNNCDDYLDYNHQPIYLNGTRDISQSASLHKIEIEISLKHEPFHSYYICLSKLSNEEHESDVLVDKFTHQGTSSVLSLVTYENYLPTWMKIIIYIIFVCFNSIFNGLNLGLMALSVEELELLVKTSESPKERKYAKDILPLRRKRNYLLCSILLSVTLTSSVSTLILDDMIHGFFAGIVSTIILCLFGEILPQSICSKYSLLIGSYTKNFTYFFIYLTSFASYPLSKIVDYLLGEEIPTKYSRDSIKELIKKSKGLEEKQCRIINGVLDLKSKCVSQRMVNLDDAYMLHEDETLTFELIVQIYNSGYSRIPVYSKHNRESIIGWFHVKDLTLVDPDNEITIKTLLSLYKHPLGYCHMNDSLFDMLLEFCNGSAHMAFVLQTIQDTNKDPYEKCIGLITLHDVLEALIQHNIYDEFDFHQGINDKNQSHPLHDLNTSGFGINYLKKLIENQNSRNIIDKRKSFNKLLDGQYQKYSTEQKINLQTKLILIQVLTTIKPFHDEFIDKSIIEKLINDDDLNLTSSQLIYKINPATELKHQTFLYKYHEPSDYFILLLEGSFIVEAGVEKIEFLAKQFDCFGIQALLGNQDTTNTLTIEQILNQEESYTPYIPEFSLKLDCNHFQNYQYQSDSNKPFCFNANTNSNIECFIYLKIDRKTWLNAVKSTKLKRNLIV